MFFGIVSRQTRVYSQFENLSERNKSYLLSRLINSSSFWELDDSYQLLIKLGLNDIESWQEWLSIVHRFGMNRQTLIFFKRTIQTMPENLRKELVGKIAEYYQQKSAQETPKFLDDNNDRSPIEQPKRIFDVLISWLTRGPQILRSDLKTGMNGLEAYDKYLVQNRQWMNGTRPLYGAADILVTCRAMQKKLQLLLTDPQYLQEVGFFNKKEPYVVIYGSFPSGRADFQLGSDIDLAVSYEKLAKGDHEKDKIVLRYDRPIYLSTWEIESAAIEVLKQRLGIKKFYDPTSHKVVTENKMYKAALAYYSPIRIKISAEKIALQVDEIDSEPGTFEFFSSRYSFVSVELK